MTTDELKKEAEEYLKRKLEERKNKLVIELPEVYITDLQQSYLASAEPREKHIAELEEEISVLLSCKNCPENKGGLICQKEYEDKCLSQKIQFIKELQKENAELKGIKDVATLIRANNDTVITLMQLNNKLVSKSQQLTKAIELIEDMYDQIPASHSDYYKDVMERAKHFLSEMEE